MGDRGNIVFKQDGGKAPNLWMYTHWRGSETPLAVRAALLRGKDRWDDEPYFARIVFDELVQGYRDTTGFGLSTYPGDNNHKLLVVNVGTGHIWTSPFPSPDTVLRRWTFEEFSKLSDSDCEGLV